ncbi:efflux RND transporter periplasmic adaptor subunit [Parvibaculum sp.]|uniref:efflux RND transporter periplasmic adaptor subunit n=1 Tax=Parvibaculum sp. TaxID=2024848 RepID=UPI003297E779
MRSGVVVKFAAYLVAAAILAGCDSSEEEAGPPAPEVSVVTIKPERLELTTELSGRTSAFRASEIRPQVNGIVLKRLFEEGSKVEEGQQLYQIDPALYQATFDSAKAALAKAQANEKTARARAARYKELVAVNAVSKQDYDDVVATLAQSTADVASAKANLDTAATNLAYTKVFSPISGIISRSSVTEGALVTANQATELATVTQLDPIYVDLTQTAADMLRMKRAMEDGRVQGIKDGKAPVTLKLDGSDEQYGGTGELQFSGVTVAPDTGMVQLRAIFPNPNAELLPGLFVRAVVQQGELDDAILVPQQGVVRTADGSAQVWLVGEEGKVEQRPVSAPYAIGDKWLVTDGLKAGDRVVVQGLQKLRPGGQVTAVEAGEQPEQQPASSPQRD